MRENFFSTVNYLIAAHRQADAISFVKRASSAGNSDADYQLGLWQLAGAPLPRDLPAARQALARAARAGHADARLIEIALTANGSGGPADWHAAVNLLDQAAQRDADAAGLMNTLRAMVLRDDGTPEILPAVENMTIDGMVRRVPQLLNADECSHVMRSVADLLQPALVSDPRTGRSIPHPIRTSDSAVIGPVREDLVIRAINMRLAAASATPVAAGEALTILRYRPGQEFRLHSDALPVTQNQRVMTVLVYLNDGFGGGETVFPDYGLSVVPKRGDAIMFLNVRPDGRPASTARHAGAPVTHGVKWLATRWIRQHAFDVWKGPEMPVG